MKNLLIGLLALTSITAFANEICNIPDEQFSSENEITAYVQNSQKIWCGKLMNVNSFIEDSDFILRYTLEGNLGTINEYQSIHLEPKIMDYTFEINLSETSFKRGNKYHYVETLQQMEGLNMYSCLNSNGNTSYGDDLKDAIWEYHQKYR